MKHTNHFILAGLIGLASGCAFKRQSVVLAPVGPPPFVEAGRAPEGGLAGKGKRGSKMRAEAGLDKSSVYTLVRVFGILTTCGAVRRRTQVP